MIDAKQTKQVHSSHYNFHPYMHKARWNSLWHQIDEVIRLNPTKVLEIGPGPGVFKYMANLFGVVVDTLDIDPELKPDFIGSATLMPLQDNSYDVVCAFQVLEHLPYESALQAFGEMVRVSKHHVVISLPDAKPVWRYLLYFPKLGYLDRLVPRPFFFEQRHLFKGQHYWEINKRGYSLEKVSRDLQQYAPVLYSYRVNENPYHRFFIIDANG